MRGTQIVDPKIPHLRQSKRGMPDCLQRVLMSRRILLARKQPRSRSCKPNLLAERFNSTARSVSGIFGSWTDALLIRRLATLRLDAPVFDSLEDLRWKGPRAFFEERRRSICSLNLFSRAASDVAKTAAQRRERSRTRFATTNPSDNFRNLRLL
jgi:hypothetical protein